MRVVVDASGLGEGEALRGIGTYVRQLLRGLVTADGVDLVALAPSGAVLPAGVVRQDVRRAAHHRIKGAVRDLTLPRELGRAHADVAHSPSLAAPRHVSVPWVQTVHDVTPLAFAHPYLAREAARLQKAAPRMRRATAIIVPSRSTADQCVRLLGIDAQRITVVHHGVPAGLRPGPRTVGAEPFVLVVASWGPHKGLVEAGGVLDVLADHGLPHRLRVIGPQHPWQRARLEEDLARSRHRDRIDIIMEHVPDLGQVYRDADALLCTSRAEGFGFPVLEAMACGTPVVAFDNTSLPEVVGAGGLLVRDGDVAAFGAVLAELLTTSSLHDEQRARGLDQVARFDETASIAGHIEVYRAAAAR